ncbi:methyltransferase domain-containing protein [Denitrobacterium detoxificans]|nr:methyltransferase domain-containing protein [Denitrobacterium detoxificans]
MRFASQVAMSLPAEDNIKALDIGCGSGFMTMLLIDAGCSATGVDFSEEMLAMARKNLAKRGYEAELMCMNAHKLEFPDGSFDFIVSRNVTWILEDVDAVYAEVMRVLAEGGVFLNLDANYGKAFNEAEARGETPTHPTQSLEQLLMRNDIARDLPITLVDRPQWDIEQFWKLGASEIRCRRLGAGQNTPGSAQFALEVHKGRSGLGDDANCVNALDTPSQPVLREEGSGADASALEARAKVMLVDYMKMGVFEFDPRKFVVRKEGVPVKLTPKEFNLLLTLARNAGSVVSSDALVKAAWGSEYSDGHANVAVYVSRIRRKIEEDPKNPRYLMTRWASGYVFFPDGRE